MEFLSFPKHNTLLGLHLHPLPTSATAFTAGNRLWLNQTSNKCAERRKPTTRTPPVSLVLTPADPVATCCKQKGSGPGLSYHISPRAAEPGCSGPLQKVTKSRNIVFRHYDAYIFHLPSRLSQEPTELEHFSLTWSCTVSDSVIPQVGRSVFPACEQLECCP